MVCKTQCLIGILAAFLINKNKKNTQKNYRIFILSLGELLEIPRRKLFASITKQIIAYLGCLKLSSKRLIAIGNKA